MYNIYIILYMSMLVIDLGPITYVLKKSLDMKVFMHIKTQKYAQYSP